MSDNLVYDKWESLIRGLPIEYHKRLADRVVACIGNWVPPEHLEDVLCDMKYHKEQILNIQHMDEQCSRY